MKVTVTIIGDGPKVLESPHEITVDQQDGWVHLYARVPFKRWFFFKQWTDYENRPLLTVKQHLVSHIQVTDDTITEV